MAEQTAWLPEAEPTVLGLYVTARNAYERWKAGLGHDKVFDVRTAEEYVFAGHPERACNPPLASQQGAPREGLARADQRQAPRADGAAGGVPPDRVVSAASKREGFASTPPETSGTESARSSDGSEPSSGSGRWPRGRYSGKQLLLALAVAVLADGLSLVLTLAPPVQWAIDVTTALLLFVVLGWHWALLPGLVMEVIPGLYVFPFWVLVVVALATVGSLRRGRKVALATPAEVRRPALAKHPQEPS